jgi:hypothetical protein
MLHVNLYASGSGATQGEGPPRKMFAVAHTYLIYATCRQLLLGLASAVILRSWFLTIAIEVEV